VCIDFFAQNSERSEFALKSGQLEFMVYQLQGTIWSHNLNQGAFMKLLNAAPKDLCSTSGTSPTLYDQHSLMDARQFVTTWSLLNAIEIDRSGALTLNGKKCDYKKITNILAQDYEQIHRQSAFKAKPLCRQSLKEALELKISEMKEELVASVISRVFSKREHDQSEVSKFIKAMSGEENPYYENLLRHWLQQVLRKLAGKKADNLLMISFMGAQGSGKTHAILKLLEVIKELTANYGVDQLMKETHYKSLEKYYVLFLDELMGIDRLEIEKFKKMISDGDMAHRQLYQTEAENISINASFIAASNKPLFENIKDRTGMRRFAEIKVLDKMNWDQINAVDYLKIWRSVDIDFDYFSLVKDRLKVEQAENTVEDIVDVFIQDYGITNEGDTRPVPEVTLNTAFQAWARKNGYQSIPSRTDFIKKIKSRCLLQGARVRIGSMGRPNCLYISSSMGISHQNSYLPE
jgi:hypothetical protein